MIKHAYAGCPVCHADPSGGELLTAYGRAQSDLLLRMRYGKPGGGSAASSEGKSDSSFDSFDSFDDDTSAGAGATTSDSKGAPPDATNSEEKAGDGATDATAAPADASTDAAKTGAAASGEAPPEAASSDVPAADAAAAGASKSAEAAPQELKVDDSGSRDTSGFLWGLVTPPDWLLLGGSYRHLLIWKPGRGRFSTFPMMADVYGQVQVGHFRVDGSIGIVRVGVGSPYARSAQITGNQGDEWNLLSRTHWVGYDLADGQVTIRAGRLNLPFGIRIPEHTMWVRQATRTDRESSQEHGVAVAYNGEKVRGEVMAIAGNYQIRPDKYRERGYSLYAEYLTSSRTALGVSSMVTAAQEDRITLYPSVTRMAHGGFIRTAFSDKTTLLAEANALKSTGREAGYVGFAQLDYEITQGLHLMLTGEVLDLGHDKFANHPRLPGDGEPQFGGWGTVDWFCLPHVEVRVDALTRQNDDKTLLGQVHVFL